jgi:hypothetical protein
MIRTICLTFNKKDLLKEYRYLLYKIDKKEIQYLALNSIISINSEIKSQSTYDFPLRLTNRRVLLIATHHS